MVTTQMKEVPAKYMFRNATKDDLDKVAKQVYSRFRNYLDTRIVARTVKLAPLSLPQANGFLCYKALSTYFIGSQQIKMVVIVASLPSLYKVSSEHLCIFPRGENYLVLHDLYVTPDSRGQGIGSGLVAATLQSGRTRGIHRFTTYSANKHWQPTLDFYREFGFEAWSFSLFLDETSIST